MNITNWINEPEIGLHDFRLRLAGFVSETLVWALDYQIPVTRIRSQVNPSGIYSYHEPKRPIKILGFTLLQAPIPQVVIRVDGFQEEEKPVVRSFFESVTTRGQTDYGLSPTGDIQFSGSPTNLMASQGYIHRSVE